MKKLTIFLLGLTMFAVVFSPSALLAQTEEKFEEPDVKDDFCGVHINFQYCRCAFHNEKQHCSSVNMDSWGARTYVMTEFRKWVGDQMETFARKCLADGYDWNLPSTACIHQPSGTKPSGATLEEQYGLPDLTFLEIPKNPKVVGGLAEAHGEIFLYSASFKKWIGPLSSGQPIYQGDVMVTTKRGSGIIRLHSNEILTDFAEIGPATFFETFPPEEPWDPSLFGVIKRGVMEIYDAVTGKPEPPVWYNQIHTPTIVTGRRGTNYIVSHNEETGASEVLVREGEVEISPVSGGEKLVLKPGNSYRYEDGKAESSKFEIENWTSKAQEYGLSGKHRVATDEDFVVPTGGPVDDTPKDGYTREQLVGDLSFVEDQFDKGFPWGVAIIIVIAAAFGIYYYRKKFQRA